MEILTDERIKQDLLAVWRTRSISVPVGVFGLVILYFTLKAFLDVFKAASVFTITLTALFLIALAAMLVILFRSFYHLYLIQAHRYTTEYDVLSVKKKAHINVSKYSWRQGNQTTLTFSENKQCSLSPLLTYYKWSTTNGMSDQSIYETSNVGDEFLLVSLNGKDVWIAYNLEFFKRQKNNPT